jgi:hypothetical protein
VIESALAYSCLAADIIHAGSVISDDRESPHGCIQDACTGLFAALLRHNTLLD